MSSTRKLSSKAVTHAPTSYLSVDSPEEPFTSPPPSPTVEDPEMFESFYGQQISELPTYDDEEGVIGPEFGPFRNVKGAPKPIPHPHPFKLYEKTSEARSVKLGSPSTGDITSTIAQKLRLGDLASCTVDRSFDAVETSQVTPEITRDLFSSTSKPSSNLEETLQPFGGRREASPATESLIGSKALPTQGMQGSFSFGRTSSKSTMNSRPGFEEAANQDLLGLSAYASSPQGLTFGKPTSEPVPTHTTFGAVSSGGFLGMSQSSSRGYGFGQAISETVPPHSSFGAPKSASTAGFGTEPLPPSSAGGLFGSPVALQQASPSVGFFGSTTSFSKGHGFGQAMSEHVPGHTSLLAAKSARTVGFGGELQLQSSSVGGLFGSPATHQPASSSRFSFGSTTSSSRGLGFGEAKSEPVQGSTSFAAAGPTSAFGFGFASQPASEVRDLFGSSAVPQQTSSTGGIFGSTAASQQTSSTGNLFGSTEASQEDSLTARGLFGSTAAPQQASSTGGLFGSTAAPQKASSAGGFFGSTAAPQQASSTGGLFGSTAAPQQASSTGGLFGSTAAPQKASSAGGFFGSTAAPQQASSTGGLFGSTTAPQQASSTGGLFGSTAAPQQVLSAGGLFGSTVAPQQASSTGSLFGSTAAPQQASSADPFGSTSTPQQALLIGNLLGFPSGPQQQGSSAAGLFGSTAAPQQTSSTGDPFASPVVSQQQDSPARDLFGSPAAPQQPSVTFQEQALPTVYPSDSSAICEALFEPDPPQSSVREAGSISGFGGPPRSGNLFGSRPPAVPSVVSRSFNPAKGHDPHRKTHPPTAGVVHRKVFGSSQQEEER